MRINYFKIQPKAKMSQLFYKGFPFLRKTDKQKNSLFVLKYESSASAKHLMAVIPASNRFKHSKTRFTCRKMMHFICIVFSTS